MRSASTKMHGRGNDFIVFDAHQPDQAPSAATLRRLADRRTGRARIIAAKHLPRAATSSTK